MKCGQVSSSCTHLPALSELRMVDGAHASELTVVESDSLSSGLSRWKVYLVRGMTENSEL